MNVYSLKLPKFDHTGVNNWAETKSELLILGKALIKSKRISFEADGLTLYGNYQFPEFMSSSIQGEIITSDTLPLLDNVGIKNVAVKGQGFVAQKNFTVSIDSTDTPIVALAKIKSYAKNFHALCKTDARSTKMFLFVSYTVLDEGFDLNGKCIVIGEVGENESDFYVPFSGLPNDAIYVLFDKAQASISGFQVAGLDAILAGPVSSSSWGAVTAQTAQINPNNAPNFAGQWMSGNSSNNPFNP